MNPQCLYTGSIVFHWAHTHACPRPAAVLGTGHPGSVRPGPPTPELAGLGEARTVTSQRAAGKLQGLWGSCQRSRKGFLEEVMLELGPEG